MWLEGVNDMYEGTWCGFGGKAMPECGLGCEVVELAIWVIGFSA